jgi:arylformamidase
MRGGYRQKPQYESPMIDWRTLPPAQLEQAYSPSSAIGGNYQPFVAQYLERSAAARAWFAAQSACTAQYDLPYGAAASQRLDVFLPSGDKKPPLLVYIHGGYWQELSKNESHFAAVQAVQAGLAHAVLDYTLAPAASVGQIVEECVQALRHLHSQADVLGFDAQRIVLAGSSAGAHLGAMVALQCPFVTGAVLVSGIYALEPLIHTSINTALGLSAAQAQALSPALMDVSHFPPTVVAVGEVETAQFKQQSQAFAGLLKPSVPVLTIAQRNHFDVILDVLDPTSALGQGTLAMMGARSW